MRTVLLVAAEPFEMEWIRPRGDLRFLKVARGPGPRLAAKAAAEAREHVDAVVSTGLCGALDPTLRVGDIVVATSVNGEPVDVPRTGSSHRSGPLVSADRVVGTVEERRKLAAAGSIAVEMEAEAVLRRARSLGVPFYCVRVVSDEADEEFAFDLNEARDAEGRFVVSRILGQALRRPLKGFPELLRLLRNSRRAARALGDFVADCDF